MARPVHITSLLRTVLRIRIRQAQEFENSGGVKRKMSRLLLTGEGGGSKAPEHRCDSRAQPGIAID
ncbi:unnamed protein product [Ascophyllum nodosum]